MKTCRLMITTLVILSFVVLGVLPMSQWAYGTSELAIVHSPGMCVTAGTRLVIAATIEASSSVADARLYFKSSAMPSYYFVTMTPSSGTTYIGVLPALKAPDLMLEYRIVAIDAAAKITRSPIYYTLTRVMADCAEQSQTTPDAPIIVYAEDPLPVSEDFLGEQVQWKTTIGAEVAYLENRSNNASDVQGQKSFPRASPLSEPDRPRVSTLTLLEIGAGIGAASAASVLLLQQPEEKIKWTIDVTNEAKKVNVEIVKAPQLQTACGTWVNNQLYVTNSNLTAITIGQLQYEIVLTKDNPAGSCEPGRVGTFATNWATVVQPGARVLIREWANEVNPCGGCPYLSAECRWNSRYIVQTSVGAAAAETDFTVKGNLCGGTSLKSLAPHQVSGDLEP